MSNITSFLKFTLPLVSEASFFLGIPHQWVLKQRSFLDREGIICHSSQKKQHKQKIRDEKEWSYLWHNENLGVTNIEFLREE